MVVTKEFEISSRRKLVLVYSYGIIAQIVSTHPSNSGEVLYQVDWDDNGPVPSEEEALVWAKWQCEGIHNATSWDFTL